MVVTGNTDNPFPPGFVDLIEPVCVDLDSDVTLSNISGDQIDQNLKQYDFGPKTFSLESVLNGESTVDRMKIHDMIDSVFVMPDVNTSEMSAHGGDELVEHHSSSETEEETFPPVETSESEQSIPPKKG